MNIWRNIVVVLFSAWLTNAALRYHQDRSAFRRFDVSALLAAKSDREALAKSGFDEYSIFTYIRDHIPLDAKILAFRYVELAYYTDHRYISDLDPAMMQVYRENQLLPTYNQLKKLGVTHILIPSYTPPTLGKTALVNVINDGDLAILDFSTAAFRLYELRKTPIKSERQLMFDGAPTLSGATATTRPALESWSFAVASKKNAPIEQAPNSNGVHVFAPENESLILFSGRGLPHVSPANAFSPAFELTAGDIYRVTAAMYGSGFIQVYLYEYNQQGTIEKSQTLWTAPLSNVATTYSTQFLAKLTGPGRLIIKLDPRGELFFSNIRLEKIMRAPTQDDPRIPSPANDFIFKPNVQSDNNAVFAHDGGFWSILPAPWPSDSTWEVIAWPNNVPALSFSHLNDNQEWLYFGVGPINRAPSRYFDQRWILPKAVNRDLLVDLDIEGSGWADVYIWWFDDGANETVDYLGRWWIPPERNRLQIKQSVPANAREFRLGLTLKGTADENQKLVVAGAPQLTIRSGTTPETNTTWQPILAYSDQLLAKQGGFWTVRQITAGDLNWQNRSQPSGISLTLAKRRGASLYSGNGQVNSPPSWSSDFRWQLPEATEKRVRFEAQISGTNPFDLYLWWFDKNGISTPIFLDKWYPLPTPNLFHFEYNLPSSAQEFRIEFLLRQNAKQTQLLTIDNAQFKFAPFLEVSAKDSITALPVFWNVYPEIPRRVNIDRLTFETAKMLLQLAPNFALNLPFKYWIHTGSSSPYAQNSTPIEADFQVHCYTGNTGRFSTFVSATVSTELKARWFEQGAIAQEQVLATIAPMANWTDLQIDFSVPTKASGMSLVVEYSGVTPERWPVTFRDSYISSSNCDIDYVKHGSAAQASVK